MSYKSTLSSLLDAILIVLTIIPVIGGIVAAGIYYFGYTGTPLVVWSLMLFATLLIGFFYLPFLTTMLVEILRALRLHHAIAGLFMLFMQATTQHGSILVQRLNQNYEWCPIQETNNGGLYTTTEDGERIDIDAELNEFYTYKGKPLGFTVEISEGVFSDILLTPESEPDSDAPYEIDLSDRRSTHDLLAYNPFTDHDGLFASAGKVHQRLTGSNGISLLLQGKEQALMDKGGKQEMSRKWYYGTVLALGLAGFLGGLFITGMI